MTKESFDYVDKDFDSLKKIKNKISLNDKDLKALQAEARKFAEANTERCKTTPRQWNKSIWKEITKDLIENIDLGSKFWSTDRGGFKKAEDLEWPADEDDITFLIFCVLKCEIRSSTISNKRKSDAEGLESSPSTPKKSKKTSDDANEDGAGTPQSKKKANKDGDNAESDAAEPDATEADAAEADATEPHAAGPEVAADATEAEAEAVKDGDGEESDTNQLTTPKPKKKSASAASILAAASATPKEKKRPGRPKTATLKEPKQTKAQKQAEEKQAALAKKAEESKEKEEALAKEAAEEGADELNDEMDVDDAVEANKPADASDKQIVAGEEEATVEQTNGTANDDTVGGACNAAAIDVDQQSDVPVAPTIEVPSRSATPRNKYSVPQDPYFRDNTPARSVGSHVLTEPQRLPIEFLITSTGFEDKPIKITCASTSTFQHVFAEAQMNSLGEEKFGLGGCTKCQILIPGGTQVDITFPSDDLHFKWAGAMTIAVAAVSEGNLHEGQKVKLHLTKETSSEQAVQA